MTYTITDQCISCENCLPHCPTNAIQKKDNGKFSINPNLCNDCANSYGTAQCMAGCPTFNGCTPTFSSLLKSAQTTKTNYNYWDNWFTTYEYLTSRLRSKKETQYWKQWFNTYSQKLNLLLHS